MIVAISNFTNAILNQAQQLFVMHDEKIVDVILNARCIMYKKYYGNYDDCLGNRKLGIKIWNSV